MLSFSWNHHATKTQCHLKTVNAQADVFHLTKEHKIRDATTQEALSHR